MEMRLSAAAREHHEQVQRQVAMMEEIHSVKMQSELSTLVETHAVEVSRLREEAECAREASWRLTQRLQRAGHAHILPYS